MTWVTVVPLVLLSWVVAAEIVARHYQAKIRELEFALNVAAQLTNNTTARSQSHYMAAGDTLNLVVPGTTGAARVLFDNAAHIRVDYI